MKRILLVASTVLCAALSGCAAISGEVAPRVAKAVNVYCLEPEATRALVRAQVAEMAKPNAIAVTCAGDAQ